MMYAIDLFKGRNLPRRSRPVSRGLTAGAFLILLITAILLGGQYLRLEIEKQSHEKSLVHIERRIGELADVRAAMRKSALNEERSRECLDEIREFLTSHSQWSDVLTALAENLPDSIALNKIQVRRERVGAGRPGGSAGDKKPKVDKYEYTLRLGACDRKARDGFESVAEYINRLQNCDAMRERVSSIRVVSQQRQDFGGAAMMRYEIDCVFK